MIPELLTDKIVLFLAGAIAALGDMTLMSLKIHSVRSAYFLWGLILYALLRKALKVTPVLAAGIMVVFVYMALVVPLISGAGLALKPVLLTFNLILLIATLSVIENKDAQKYFIYGSLAALAYLFVTELWGLAHRLQDVDYCLTLAKKDWRPCLRQDYPLRPTFFSMILCLYWVSLGVDAKRKWLQVLAVAVAVGFLVGASLARTPIYSLAIFLVWIAASVRKEKGRDLFLGAGALAIAISIGVYYFIAHQYDAAAQKLVQNASPIMKYDGALLEPGGTVGARVELWRQMVGSMHGLDFVFGRGWIPATAYPAGQELGGVHNVPFEVFVDSGAIGLMLCAAMLLLIGREIFRPSNNRFKKWSDYLAPLIIMAPAIVSSDLLWIPAAWVFYLSSRNGDGARG